MSIGILCCRRPFDKVSNHSCICIRVVYALHMVALVLDGINLPYQLGVLLLLERIRSEYSFSLALLLFGFDFVPADGVAFVGKP